MNPYYVLGLTIGAMLGITLFSLLFRYAILGKGGTKAQHLWVIMLTGVVAVGFSAFGDGTDGFANRLKNPPDMAQALAYAIATFVVASVVSLLPAREQTQEVSRVRGFGMAGRALALVIVVPMVLLGLGTLGVSSYSIVANGRANPGLGGDRADMREIMLKGEMAPFWQLVDQEAPEDLDYIIDRMFADEERYSSRQDVADKLGEEVRAYRVEMAKYAPALTDAQRAELIAGQADFLRAFQDDPETCALVAMQGGGALSEQQLSAVIAVFNRSMTSMMRLLFEASVAAQNGATVPRAASDDDYASLAASMVESGTSERELQALISEDGSDPEALCAASLAFMDASARLPDPAGASIRYEVTQGLLTSQ